MFSRAKARAIRHDNRHAVFSIGMVVSVAMIAASIASLPPLYVRTTATAHPPQATAGATECADEAWPYYPPNCLRSDDGMVRPARVIPLDRVVKN
jgi:hypothetical protein